MASDDEPSTEFKDIDIDNLLPGLKQEKIQLSATLRKYHSFCRRRVSDKHDPGGE